MVEQWFCKPLVVGSIPTVGSLFMSGWLTSFVLVFSINVLYTRYLKAVSNNTILTASFWASSINIVAALASINYNKNHWLIIPSCIGAFVGTYVSLKIK